jgi:hypothetical protein
MMIRNIFLFTAIFAILVLASPVLAAEGDDSNEPIDTSGAPVPVICSATEAIDLGTDTVVICGIYGPAEVQGYRIRCSNASFVDFSIADCCMPGDHWSLKGKNWDIAPNTSVVTSPGPRDVYGNAGRVYNYGGTAWRPGNMDVYLQCTYLHGVDVFPAGSWVNIRSDGACLISQDVIRSRIDRMP